MRRAAKVDVNQMEIVNYLRSVGASVAITSTIGKGFPDLVVGWKGRNYLVEVKQTKGKLTDDQFTFAAHWKGQIAVVRSVIDVCDLLDINRPRINIMEDE